MTALIVSFKSVVLARFDSLNIIVNYIVCNTWLSFAISGHKISSGLICCSIHMALAFESQRLHGDFW